MGTKACLNANLRVGSNCRGKYQPSRQQLGPRSIRDSLCEYIVSAVTSHHMDGKSSIFTVNSVLFSFWNYWFSLLGNPSRPDLSPLSRYPQILPSGSQFFRMAMSFLPASSDQYFVSRI